MMEPLKNLETVHAIQQFYFREARLLDERKYQSWMELLTPDIEYTIPNRANTGTQTKQRNKQEFLDLSQELSQGLEAPLRQDDFLTLTLRANRPASGLTVADNPLVRTVRLVSNIEPYKIEHSRYKVFNNVSMSYSRHNRDNHTYYFSRRDELEIDDDKFKLAKREIILDWNVVTGPSVAMIL